MLNRIFVDRIDRSEARSRWGHTHSSSVGLRLSMFASIFTLQSVIAWLFKERIVNESPQCFFYQPNLDQFWLWIGFAVTAALSWVLPKRLESFGSWTGWILYLLIVVPAWPMIFSMGMEHNVLGFLLGVVGPLFMLVLLLNNVGNASARGHRWRVLSSLSGLLLPMIVIEALIFLRFRDQMVWSVDIGDVYERRLETRQFAASVWSYLQSNLDHAFIPFAIAWGIAYRNWGLLLVSVVGFALIYAISGTKSSFMVPFSLIIIAILDRWFVVNPCRVVLAIVALLVVLGAVGSIALDGLLIERVWCSPTLSATRYLNYFGAKEPLWGRDMLGVAEMFYDSNRSPSASIMIGDQVLDNPQSNDNSNIFVNGYAQAGLIGAWVSAALAAIIGRVLQHAVADHPPQVQAMIALNFAFVLFEKALHTSLLTGGLVVFVALAVLTRRPKSRDAR